MLQKCLKYVYIFNKIFLAFCVGFFLASINRRINLNNSVCTNVYNSRAIPAGVLKFTDNITHNLQYV